MNAAAKFSRSLSLQREFAQMSAKRLREKVSRSLNNSANSAIAKMMNNSPSKGITSQKSDSVESTEISVHTPLLSRINSPTDNELPKGKTNYSDIKGVQPYKSSEGKPNSKNGCDNSAYTAETKPSKREARVSRSNTIVRNPNDVSSNQMELKVMKDTLSNSVDSRSKLSSVDVS